MTARLPVPGQDDNTWGDILNDFLLTEHNANGTLKIRTDGTVAPLSSGKVPLSNLGSGTASSSNFLRGDGTWAVPSGGGTVTSVTAADSTVTVGGTASAPTIAVNAISESKVTNLTTDLAAKANTSSLSTVATSGSYTDLSNKPTIPTVTGTNTGDQTLSLITNTLTISGGNGNSVTLPSGVTLDSTAADIQPLGTQAAGSVGKAADAGHVHAMPRLDQVSAPTAAVALNSQKITGLANGTASSDAAAFGQIPTAGVGASNYAAGNDSRITGALQSTTAATTYAPIASPTFSGTVTTPALKVTTGSGTAGQVLTSDVSGNATWQAATSSATSIYGNGSGGAITLDGTTVYNSFASLSGSTYTLKTSAVTSPPSSLTVNAGITLQLSGIPLIVSGTLTNNGTISNNGGSASGSTAGAFAAHSMYGALVAKAGVTGVGTAGTAQAATIAAGVGGTGGTGSSGAGGSGGTVTSNNSTYVFNSPQTALMGVVSFSGSVLAVFGGTAGGSGGGDGTNLSGGSGAGGGVVAILAKSIVNNSVISAVGGAGGSATTGNCGGGGGGGGGLILLYSPVAVTGTGSTNVTGGSGGSGIGTGTAGATGASGSVATFIVS
jgi:collagen type VII alpha